MAFYPLFRGMPFDPEYLALMSSVIEEVSQELGLAKREDAFRDLIARAVIDCAQRGIRNPTEMRRCAHKALQRIGVRQATKEPSAPASLDKSEPQL